MFTLPRGYLLVFAQVTEKALQLDKVSVLTNWEVLHLIEFLASQNALQALYGSDKQLSLE